MPDLQVLGVSMPLGRNVSVSSPSRTHAAWGVFLGGGSSTWRTCDLGSADDLGFKADAPLKSVPVSAASSASEWPEDVLMAISLRFRSRPGPRSPRRPRPPHPSRLRRGQHRAPSTRLVLSWFASDALTPGDALASPVPCGWGLTLPLSGTQRAVLLCAGSAPPRTPPAPPRLLTRGSQKSAALSLPPSLCRPLLSSCRPRPFLHRPCPRDPPL